MSDSIKKLTDLFSKFPTVGKRTASRFVFHLIRLPKEKREELANAIKDLGEKVALCLFCFQPFEISNREKLCTICRNSSRNHKLLCIVEKETDLLSIEGKNKYRGIYFILGGVISPQQDASSLRINALLERVKNPSGFGLAQQPEPQFTEIILATNPTPEGIATSHLVEKALKETGSPAKITHLAKGLPMGGELEYADEETLGEAFEGRK